VVDLLAIGVIYSDDIGPSWAGWTIRKESEAYILRPILAAKELRLAPGNWDRRKTCVRGPYN